MVVSDLSKSPSCCQVGSAHTSNNGMTVLVFPISTMASKFLKVSWGLTPQDTEHKDVTIIMTWCLQTGSQRTTKARLTCNLPTGDGGGKRWKFGSPHSRCCGYLLRSVKSRTLWSFTFYTSAAHQRVVSAASLLKGPLGFLTVHAQLVNKNIKGAFLTGLNNIEESLKVPYLWAQCCSRQCFGWFQISHPAK